MDEVRERAYIRVLNNYVVAITDDGKVYSFYRPSFIGYKYRRPYVLAGIILFILGALLYLEIMSINTLKPSDRQSAMFLIIGFFIAGIVLFLLKKRDLMIESMAGTRIVFVNPVFEEELLKIIEKIGSSTYNYGSPTTTSHYQG